MKATHEIKETICLQRLYLGIGFIQQDVRIDCDSESVDKFFVSNLE